MKMKKTLFAIMMAIMMAFMVCPVYADNIKSGPHSNNTINSGDTNNTAIDNTSNTEFNNNPNTEFNNESDANAGIGIVDSFNAPDKITTEAEINTHIQPMNTPVTIAPEYNGPFFKDHKYQIKILNFILREQGLKPFKIMTKKGCFVKKSSKSASSAVVGGYPEQDRVYVFRDEDDLKKLKEFTVLGYADTYSKGKDTLMSCFNQAVIDSGAMGGNALVILETNFVAGVKSSTIGLGFSGANGLMHGSNSASVFGSAIGYASSKATTQTNPFIHGIVLYSEELE